MCGVLGFRGVPRQVALVWLKLATSNYFTLATGRGRRLRTAVFAVFAGSLLVAGVCRLLRAPSDLVDEDCAESVRRDSVRRESVRRVRIELLAHLNWHPSCWPI
jgi:hypothetical protein